VTSSAIPGDPTFRRLANLAHCEGVATGPDGALWAGGENGRVYRIDPADGSVDDVGSVGGWALGLCLDADSRVYVCVYDGRAIVRLEPATGRTETYANDGLIRNPNWPVFAPDGTLFVSDSGGEDPGDRDGRVLAVPSGGGPAELVETRELAFANGMAMSVDGTLYVLESFEPRVLALRDGALSVHAELPGTVPDGLALDEDGGLIVACYQPNRIVRVPPGGGEPQLVLEDWTGQRLLTPTNVAFFGPERRSLAIASLCGWSLTAIDTPWRGQPLFYPTIP
jgi:sugar lactone lactonase YvrE